MQRIGSLRRLIEVMVGERLSAERRSSLDHALASYYAQRRERTGFRDFYAYLEEIGGNDPESSSGRAIAHLLRPFATGSLRHLLSDEGDDLLAHEALVTVFDLHLLEPELRPAAAMVCTETVWAAAAQDPRPRLLVVDEVWSIMQHPEGAAFMVSDGETGQEASPWPCSSSPRTCRTCSQRGLVKNHHRPFSGRALLQKRRLQAVVAAGRRRRLDRGRSLRPAGGTATLAPVLSPGRRAVAGEGQPLSHPHRGHPRGDRGHRVASRSAAIESKKPNSHRGEATQYEYQRQEDAIRRRAQQAPSRPAGGDAAPGRGAHPAGRGEPAPVHRRPRTLLPGAGWGFAERRHPAGPLPGRPGGAQPGLRPLPPGPHPPGAARGRPPGCAGGRAGRDHRPEGADGPEYVPLRTFRDDDLLDPGSDPLLAVIGALSNLRHGERLVARLLLRSLGPDWSQAHQVRAHQAPLSRRTANPPTPTRPNPCRLDGVTMAVLGVGALAAVRGYLWVQDGEYLEGGAAGLGHGSVGAAHRRRLGLVALEAGPQPGLRPHADPGEGVPRRLPGRVAADRRHPRNRSGCPGSANC